jgi:hypothetical protein
MGTEPPPRNRGGTVITDELAEELAREAEAGYGLDQLTDVRTGPGRKSLAGGAGKSPRVNVRLQPSIYERLAQAAADTGGSISDLIRDAIERQLRRLERGARR